jgi:hypothetical protein
LSPLNIFFDLIDEKGWRSETDFISDSLFEIDLNFFPIDLMIEIQNIDFQGKRSLFAPLRWQESGIQPDIGKTIEELLIPYNLYGIDSLFGI